MGMGTHTLGMGTHTHTLGMGTHTLGMGTHTLGMGTHTPIPGYPGSQTWDPGYPGPGPGTHPDGYPEPGSGTRFRDLVPGPIPDRSGMGTWDGYPEPGFRACPEPPQTHPGTPSREGVPGVGLGVSFGPVSDPKLTP